MRTMDSKVLLVFVTLAPSLTVSESNLAARRRCDMPRLEEGGDGGGKVGVDVAPRAPANFSLFSEAKSVVHILSKY